jgi:hypothetical protein
MRLVKTLCAALLVPAVAIAPALAQQQGGKPAVKTAGAASASAAVAAAPASPPATPAASAKVSASAGSGPAAGTGAGAAASGAGPSATAAVAPAAAGSAHGMDGATYAVRLRDLEQRIDELKEQIRRSHTRLSLLTDTILSGGVAGSRADIQFQNDMSSAFRLTRALFVLDGAVQYNKSDDSGALAEQAQIPIFSGSIPPGDHTLQVLVQLQGNGYGVFSYLKGYKFEVRSSHSFTAVEGKTLTVQVVAYEKGGVTTALEERPAVRYVEKVTAGFSPVGQPAATNAPPGAAARPASVSTGFSIGTGGK